jgi:hypothetical protein
MVSTNYPFKCHSIDVTIGDSDEVKIIYCYNFNKFNPKKPINIFYGTINERFDISPDFVQVIFFPYFNQKYDKSFYKTFLWKAIESFYPNQSISYNTYPIYDVENIRDLHKIVYYDYKL